MTFGPWGTPAPTASMAGMAGMVTGEHVQLGVDERATITVGVDDFDRSRVALRYALADAARRAAMRVVQAFRQTEY